MAEAKRPRAPKAEWHLICITRKGRVSILKNLDLRTAREAYKKLMPDQHPEKIIWGVCKRTGKQIRSYSGRGFSSSGDGLETIEAVGPEGQQLNPWFGVEPRERHLHCQCGCLYDTPVEAPKVPEDTRLAKLYKEVPTAFWLEQHAHG